MGKKRKASGRSSQPTGPQELDPKDARLGPITTFEDVADSEDEYFINRDRIMLDDGPDSKRRRRDDDLELSDEEVLGYSDDDDSQEGEDEHDQKRPSKSKSSSRREEDDDVQDDEAGEDDGEGDAGWWGSSKGEYYNADNIETEADAEEEEAEAKRLQKKKLSKMAEEDFIFDGDEWLAADAGAEEDDGAVTEVLKDVEVTDDMGTKERLALLRSRYPELEHLVKEFQQAQPLLVELKKVATKSTDTSVETIKYWVLGCYVACLASYFAILTSPARDAAKAQKTLDPSDLRDHDVMDTLVKTRDAWQKIKDFSSLQGMQGVLPSSMEIDGETHELHDEELAKPKKSKKKSTSENAVQDAATAKDRTKKKQDAKKSKAIEDSVADLYNLPLGVKTKKSSQAAKASRAEDNNSDFGEEDSLDARTASEKAARKKSLKFYTSQITQKANKRAGAGRDAGGDMDIPHRERLRDRQARLVAAAEKRGGKDSKHGADLGDDSDEDDSKAADAIRGNEDEYYDMVAQKSKDRREDKAARYAAYAAASKADRVVEQETVGEDGKRKINYAIEKNKGLTPRRKKEVRNPRVKKRMQYEEKQKKLRSMKPTWKGGEPKGGYQGELSGINPGVIKSTRL